MTPDRFIRVMETGSLVVFILWLAYFVVGGLVMYLRYGGQMRTGFKAQGFVECIDNMPHPELRTWGYVVVRAGRVLAKFAAVLAVVFSVGYVVEVFV